MARTRDWRTVGLVLLLACVGTSCDQVTDEDFDPTVMEAWFPLVDGAAWRYAYEVVEVGAEPIQARVLDVAVAGTERRGGLDYVRIGEAESSPDLYRVGADSVFYEWPRDMPFEIPILDGSSQPAASLPIDIEYVEGGDTLRATGSLAYKRTEAVTLSFGVIPDCRVFKLRGALAVSSEPEFDLEFVTTAWFARGIGYVKKVHEVYDGGTLTETATRTLLYYSIPGGETDGDSGLYPVTGRVVEWDGDPISDVGVKLWTGGDSDPTAVTGADGFYTFADVPTGPYMVSVSSMPDGYTGATMSADFSVVAGPTQAPDLVLVLTSGPFAARGALRNPAGLPIPGAWVAMVRGPATLDWLSDANGDWWGYSLAAGTYTVSVHMDHFTFTPDSVVVTLDESTEGGAVSGLDFTGTGGATVTGRIVTPLAIPLEGVLVGFGNPHGTPQLFDTTDAGGVYAFPDIPPGPYWVWGADMRYTFSYGYAPGIEVEIVDTAGSVADIEALPAGSGYTLSGTVRNSRGMGPMGDGGTIRFYSPLFGTDESVAVNTGDGTFSVEVSEGPYVVSVDLTVYPDPTPDSVVVTVDGASVAGIAFTFTGYTMTGRVADSTGAGIGGATVGIDGSGMAQVQATTAGDGSFSFSDLVLGNYNVSVWKDGYTFTPSTAMHTVNGNTSIGTITGSVEPAG